MRDLIFVSLENWDEIWRRNQLVCAEWARRHPLAFAVAGSNVSTDSKDESEQQLDLS